MDQSRELIKFKELSEVVQTLKKRYSSELNESRKLSFTIIGPSICRETYLNIYPILFSIHVFIPFNELTIISDHNKISYPYMTDVCLIENAEENIWGNINYEERYSNSIIVTLKDNTYSIHKPLSDLPNMLPNNSNFISTTFKEEDLHLDSNHQPNIDASTMQMYKQKNMVMDIALAFIKYNVKYPLESYFISQDQVTTMLIILFRMVLMTILLQIQFILNY